MKIFTVDCLDGLTAQAQVKLRKRRCRTIRKSYEVPGPRQGSYRRNHAALC